MGVCRPLTDGDHDDGDRDYGDRDDSDRGESDCDDGDRDRDDSGRNDGVRQHGDRYDSDHCHHLGVCKHPCQTAVLEFFSKLPNLQNQRHSNKYMLTARFHRIF